MLENPKNSIPHRDDLDGWAAGVSKRGLNPYRVQDIRPGATRTRSGRLSSKLSDLYTSIENTVQLSITQSLS